MIVFVIFIASIFIVISLVPLCVGSTDTQDLYILP